MGAGDEEDDEDAPEGLKEVVPEDPGGKKQ